MFDIKWKNCGLLGAGILLGSYGLRILTSRDAKKAYTHGTAAVFRMKDEAQQIEDAKAILAAANESAE